MPLFCFLFTLLAIGYQFNTAVKPKIMITANVTNVLHSDIFKFVSIVFSCM